MTRAEAEMRILEKMKEIREIMREYNPKDMHLSMSIQDDGDGYISFFNHFWDHPDDGVLDFSCWDGKGGENDE